MTRQRAAVSDLLERTDDFRSAQQLHESLRDAGDAVGLATVYRTLQTMAETGEVDVLRTDDGEALYRRCESVKHHHHLVCRTCGTTVEISGEAVEAWAEEMAAHHGFTDIEHTIDLFGQCADCSRQRAVGRA
ncbi:Fur family transcriptional regulator [Georgenia satyanarayanai]|uniref:Fur family transcriptional regulator n=1 Tax=Georgenia satyanarayanai TaxID=860221 RepID=UPI0029C9B629|nr:Fur family transcriptional regulator [Georgenia satyanarayanai]